ncbi:MAG: glycosyltransferase family 4 protein [Alphaproteobacteria bacterium]|nr:glycosyltransferase family 4 protein [Alphaproteobacteria bacterium]
MKVCFVALYSYSLFNQKTHYVFGGSEVRAWILARGLAQRPGCKVGFVVFDHGQNDREIFGGVTLYKQPYYRSYESAAPVPSWFGRKIQGIRDRLWPQARVADLEIDGINFDPAALAAYSDIDADVFVVPGVTNLTAEVLAFCLTHGKRLVILAGSDSNFNTAYRPDVTERDVYGNEGRRCHFALTRAHRIIVQTADQAQLCRTLVGREAAILANPIDLGEVECSPVADRSYFLWVGKSDTVKRPELLLEIARQNPGASFLMVMNKSVEPIHAAILAEAPPNVTIIERLPFQDSDAMFSKAIALINTSRFEGFPNTFLQAGKYGVPILSLKVDPDGFIAREDCGVVTDGDLERLSGAVALLLEDVAKRQVYGERARAYVARHHALPDRVRELDMYLRG